ncbi:MAG: twin transmembrane helix small protein [Alphaproteobacteria bacterium]|nr:twin transmembrane helix small protein [Alphaproteobacteria bacterium]
MFNTILTYLLYAALLGTLVTLVVGILTMFRKQPTHSQKSNQLMRLRVLLQGIALIILALLLFKRL